MQGESKCIISQSRATEIRVRISFVGQMAPPIVREQRIERSCDRTYKLSEDCHRERLCRSVTFAFGRPDCGTGTGHEDKKMR